MAGTNMKMANNTSKQHSIYPMEKITFGSRELQKRYEEILGPLTLFAPKLDEEAADKVDLEVERPVTPIDESIKAPPTTFSELARLIRRRIAANTECPHLTTEEQQMLAGVIMGEVNSIWPDIRRQVDDPFLTFEENKELQRRITVHIVTVCQQLFQHYVEKAKMLTDRNVFSGVANMSRLKAQVSLDANKFLNILAIRRHIVADIRGDYPESEADSQPVLTSPRPASRTPKDEKVPLSYQKLIATSRPKRRRNVRPTAEQQVRDMAAQFPHLHTGRVLDYLPDLPTLQRGVMTSSMRDEARREEDEEDETYLGTLGEGETETFVESRASAVTASIDLSEKLDGAEQKGYRLPRSKSLPEFHGYESIYEEIGFDEPPTDDGRPQSAHRHRPKYSLEPDGEEEAKDAEEITAAASSSSVVRPMRPTPAATPTSAGAGDGTKPATHPGGETYPDSSYQLQQDLARLSTYRSAKTERKKEALPEEEDLPPLLQAVDHNERQDNRRAVMRRKMRMSSEAADKKEKEEVVEIREPTHPQPATVTATMPNKSTVRTSDVRVSERVSQTAVTLNLYQTVFNELTDEVDGNTIKKLDGNLFRGGEIKEVYEEILKTLPTDHLAYDTDAFVETAASQYALHKAPLMASTTLNGAQKGRVLNPDLVRSRDAPWGKERAEWCKSPIFNATFARQNPAQPSKVNTGHGMLQGAGGAGGTSYFSDSLGMGLNNSTNGLGMGGAGGGSTFNLENSGGLGAGGGGGFGRGMLMDDRNARAYASWLQWWKSTVNCEDYIKYVATQETDFLGAVFHFFNEDTDSKAEKVEEKVSSSKLEREKEREAKLEELRVQKKEYVPGQWNVGSVMLGGLGKDPEVKVHIDDSDSLSQENLGGAVRRSHSRAVSRNASRNTITPRGGTSPIQSRHSFVHSRGTYRTSSRVSLSNRSDGAGSAKTKITTQSKLESIWNALEMPENLRLDMAIKYSSDKYAGMLDEAIGAWQLAASAIVDREGILTSLENFERFASDPDRFFQKGYRGSSVARLEEARQRSDFYAALRSVENKVKKRVKALETKFHDTISYQGRPYLDKMKLDCTEMLYWLQQERRERALERAAMLQDVKIPIADLSPISNVAPSISQSSA